MDAERFDNLIRALPAIASRRRLLSAALSLVLYPTMAEAYRIAAQACRSRFPRCGGFIIWMGHDCFPCAANTSIIDFEGNPKPAALALRKIWRGE